MRFALVLALASGLIYGPAIAATTKKTTKKTSNETAHATKSGAAKRKTSKPSRSKSSTHRKTASKSAKTSKSSKTARRGKTSHTKTAAAWRSRQLAPSPDRYKEIQAALVQRGYLKKDANGVWDGDSADALRRFQQDQNLEATGKLNSLSLIALGLGPKHSAPVAPPATALPAASPQTTVPHAPQVPVSLPAPPQAEPPATTPPGPAAAGEPH